MNIERLIDDARALALKQFPEDLEITKRLAYQVELLERRLREKASLATAPDGLKSAIDVLNAELDRDIEQPGIHKAITLLALRRIDERKRPLTVAEAAARVAPPAGVEALTLDNAPIGTFAPAILGGGWTRTERGWKVGGGGTFPRPGGDWNGKLVAAAPPQVEQQTAGAEPTAPHLPDLPARFDTVSTSAGDPRRWTDVYARYQMRAYGRACYERGQQVERALWQLAATSDEIEQPSPRAEEAAPTGAVPAENIGRLIEAAIWSSENKRVRTDLGTLAIAAQAGSLYLAAAPACDSPVVAEPVEANNDEVICPNCTHQFRAIPVNVQKELRDAARPVASTTDAMPLQFTCENGCGVVTPVLLDFEYERTTTPEGRLLESKCAPRVACPKCHAGVDVWDERESDVTASVAAITTPRTEGGSEPTTAQKVLAALDPKLDIFPGIPR